MPITTSRNSLEILEKATSERQKPRKLVSYAYVKELPDFYIFYCARCRHVETVKEERAA